jgi:hypothetical protein
VERHESRREIKTILPLARPPAARGNARAAAFHNRPPAVNLKAELETVADKNAATHCRRKNYD